MSIVPNSVTAVDPTPALQLDYEHAEQMVRTFSALVVDPLKNTLAHFLPGMSVPWWGYMELRKHDPAQEALCPQSIRSSILKELQFLTNAAGIPWEISFYMGLTYSFSSCGGFFSLTKPIVFLPYQLIMRVGKKAFTQQDTQQETSNEKSNVWQFTDDELRFFIARELSHVKGDVKLFRIAAKVILAAALYFLFTAAMGWWIGPGVLFAAVAYHIFSGRLLEARADLGGVKILAQRFEGEGGAKERAKNAALSALEKIQKQNLEKYKASWLCRRYLSSVGNNFLDLEHPLLTSRIAALQKLKL